MKRTVLLLVLMAAMFPLAASGESYRQRLQISEYDSLKISADIPEVIIEPNDSKGSVTVSLEGPSSDRFNFSVESHRNGISIEVRKKRTFGIDLIDVFGTELRITIPKHLLLGNVEISSVSGGLEVAMPIEAQEITLETVSGRLSFETLVADREVELHSVSGRIEGKSVEGSAIDVETVSGAIRLGSVTVLDDDLSIDSISGAVDLDLVEADRTEINTISGSIDMTLVKSFTGTVETHTIGGSVNADLPNGTTTSKDRKTTLFTIGNGSGHHELSTTSGAIRIRR